MKPEVIGVTTEVEVRLDSYDQSVELENYACAGIKKAGEDILKVIASAPAIDMETVNRNMYAISSQTQECAEKMGKDILRNLECVGFHPTYSI